MLDLEALDADLPVLVLHEPALAHNLAVMRDYCTAQGVELAPHAKTHMSRELVRRQLDAGAWGFTAATPRQVRALAEFGVPRILHANPLVDARAIAWVARELARDAAPEYLCYVESAEGLALLATGLAEAGAQRPVPVLLELGFAGGRTGVRSDAAALELGRAVAATPGVELAGVSVFEGLMPLAPGQTVPDGARELLDRVHAVVEGLRGEFAGTPIVTAGGSSFFDLVVERIGPATWAAPTTVVLRSGCYLTHDHGVYARTSPFGYGRGPSAPRFEAALELYASVLATPEPGLAILGFGRREVPTDDRLPVVLGLHGASADVTDWTVTGVNDHHAFVRVAPGTEPAVGSIVRLGISHPCGAFDRWRAIPLIDAAGRPAGVIRPEL